MVKVLMTGNHRRVKKLPRPISTRQKFAVGVRTERRAQGLSQEQLAERAGMHPAYIGGVERGERNISVDNMDRIAKALRVATADLFK